jgi:hypothetical protein
MCCFSCCTAYVCSYWGWTVRVMWCYCFTKCAVSVARPSVFVCTEDEQTDQCDATASPNVLFQLLYRLCLFVMRMNKWSNVMLLLHQMCCFNCSTVCVCLYWGWTDGLMWCYCFTKCAVSVAVPSVCVCTEDEQMEQCDATASPNVPFQLLYRLCLFVLRMKRWKILILLLHQMTSHHLKIVTKTSTGLT